MSQGAMTTAKNTRALALERRRAMSTAGKAALQGRGGAAPGAADASLSAADGTATRRTAAATVAAAGGSAREAALARRKAMSSRGKLAVSSQDRTRGASPPRAQETLASVAVKPDRDCSCGCGGERKTQDGTAASAVPSENGGSRPRRHRHVRRTVDASGSARTVALARRKAMSSRGKAGLADEAFGAARTVRSGNPELSGRELAQAVRARRSRHGGAGEKKSLPCGRQRESLDSTPAAAQDAHWKVGSSQTGSGQAVTGTMVGRQANMTGDEPSTCRTITGTEYLGADIFREFCRTDPQPATARKVAVTTTSHGNAVSGNRLGRASNVTGNEPGTCNRVTGDEYVSAEQFKGFCSGSPSSSPRKISMAETMKGKSVTGSNVGRSQLVTGDERGMRRETTGTQYTRPSDIGDAPDKVGTSRTLRGGSVTGTMIGRRERVTGDEPGSCRNVTGDDYIGKEQYKEFCEATPARQDSKVEKSVTLSGRDVTGTMAGRSLRVTGNEPGTCKAVTGTPYAGGEQYQAYCAAEQADAAEARTRPASRTWGMAMTGRQPGVNGNMTGAEKGACEPVSGSPYIGADQVAEVCPGVAAEPGSPDFPQLLEQMPWTHFSVAAPAHAGQQRGTFSEVTGSRYERGNITGPFGMASGKVTGTEEARFDGHQTDAAAAPDTVASVHGRIKSRITGEGMDAGQRITGDDWERGDHVTGTEGASATLRNPTLRNGAMRTMQVPLRKPEGVPQPVSRVTGGSGNTDKGSLVTYSGGARG